MVCIQICSIELQSHTHTYTVHGSVRSNMISDDRVDAVVPQLTAV